MSDAHESTPGRPKLTPPPRAAATPPGGALMPPPESVTIGLLSISDRASSGVYEDKGIPAL